MAWKDEAQGTLTKIRELLDVNTPDWTALVKADANLTTLLEKSVQLFQRVTPGQPLATIDLRLMQAKDRIELLHSALLTGNQEEAVEYTESALQLLNAAVAK